MSEQKAFIVSKSNEGTLTELNKLLALGWNVVQTCPMPSSCASCGRGVTEYEILPTCLVVIERAR